MEKPVLARVGSGRDDRKTLPHHFTVGRVDGVSQLQAR